MSDFVPKSTTPEDDSPVDQRGDKSIPLDRRDFQEMVDCVMRMETLVKNLRNQSTETN
ncbi:MAG: hypothetical protein LBC70_04580 [Chitinispirillales bacterium]|jgi:hypothetical protein|nr:hypothetical protein [Chitinispirillales bacterium]